MAVTQTQRILDLLLAGHGKDEIAGILGVSNGAVEAAAQDLNATPSGQLGAFTATALNVGGTTIDAAGNADVNGTLGVDGAATFDGSVAVTGEVAAGSVEAEGGIGAFGTEPPGAASVIAGALSTVADAPAKAVLTSLKNALVATGQATDATT